eukprot:Blabericola_migrator_1__4742@NODE_249_length_10888_cov_100_919231_g210_i0_p2_GENE_NODE_249_length_10888_cov_100_919231_g210_i0NODE_249_length_10888_cov_100_919231_g210_i0_p2_ORF_typecomplete_len785_score177_43DEAD/PF00270_29/1_5e36Helicase_C/PF00271_31/2_3e02Helicase_C/PF00271_31/23Helicase_C/PF00271_31/3_3e22ERCC3_RAD25_C/PF16203_5/5_4e03ERCC3_RAD25_C/PF16203_5/2_6e02ERCC3_RAD25_C/PF16203_5/15ERCC3_RAD25_C/PF16203_5/1_6e06ResIII/PF04851_15/4e08ResIII/PF04851_15/2_2e03ResIII/PF04851_15/3_7e03SNF
MSNVPLHKSVFYFLDAEGIKGFDRTHFLYVLAGSKIKMVAPFMKRKGRPSNGPLVKRRKTAAEKPTFNKVAKKSVEEKLNEIDDDVIPDVLPDEMEEGKLVTESATPLEALDSTVNSTLTFDIIQWGRKREHSLEPRLVRQLKYLKFTTATKVQVAAIKELTCSVRIVDGMIRSQTGSGKTLAFLIPPLDRLLKLEAQKRERMIKARAIKADDKSFVISRSQGTRILVISPTRELALQTEATAKKLTQMFPWIATLALVGGAKKKSEKASLRKGATILVATPGRIIDHLGTTSSFRNTYLLTLVLDEADRLLDLGFESKLRRIVHELRENLGKKLQPITPALPKNSPAPTRDQLEAERAAQRELMRAVAAGRIDAESAKEATEAANAVEIVESDDEDDVAVNPVTERELLLEKFESPSKKFQVIVASATLTNGVATLAKFALKNNTASIDSFGKVVKQKAVTEEVSEEAIEDAASEASTADEDEGTPPESGDSAESAPVTKWDVPSTLKQAFVKVSTTKHRLLCLLCLLKMRAQNKKKTLVFVNGCEEVEYYHALCESLRWPNAPEGVNKRQEGLQQQKKAVLEKAREMITDVDDLLFDMADQETNVNVEVRLFSNEKVLESSKCFKLHGSMPKEDRMGNVREFSTTKEAAVLFTTDVSARGLNLPALDLVIQVDPPAEVCDYIHRIGRTARMGAPGSSVIFLLEHETGYAEELKRNNACPNGIVERPESTVLQTFMPNTARKSNLVPSLLPESLKHLRDKVSSLWKSVRLIKVALSCRTLSTS